VQSTQSDVRSMTTHLGGRVIEYPRWESVNLVDPSERPSMTGAPARRGVGVKVGRGRGLVVAVGFAVAEGTGSGLGLGVGPDGEAHAVAMARIAAVGVSRRANWCQCG